MCECSPSVEFPDGGMVIVHNSFDGREHIERLTGGIVAPGKKWGNFVDPEVGETDQTCK